MLSDAFKYAGAKNGPQETAIVNGAIYQNPYESNTARTMERLANMALDRNMARPPTVTIRRAPASAAWFARAGTRTSTTTPSRCTRRWRRNWC